MSATAATVSTRPLKPILEDVEDSKSVTASDGHFFSDDELEDENIVTHKATPSIGLDKITFSNSSFSTLIKGTSIGSGPIDAGSNRSILLQPSPPVPNRAGVANILLTDPQTTTPTAQQDSSASDHYSGSFLTEDDENVSPWTANPFEPQVALEHRFAEQMGPSGDAEIEDPFGFAAWESGFARRHSGDFSSASSAKPWQSFKNALDDVHDTTFQKNGSVRPPLKFVNPDSPVPSDSLLPDTDVGDFRTLREELQTAKDEISLLMEAVHEKDMSVITAYKHAEELKEKYTFERRDGPLMQQRLEAALRNASELEGKNVLLTTQVAELESAVRRTSSRFSDIATLLGPRTQLLERREGIFGLITTEREVTAKTENLLRVVEEFTETRGQNQDDLNVQHNLYKEITSLRKQIENQERHIIQVEDFESRKLAARDQEIRSLKDRLNVADEKLQEHEKLNIAFSAETKKLSVELKVSQHIIDRKDSLIQELTHPDTSSDSALASTIVTKTDDPRANPRTRAMANHAGSFAEEPSGINGKAAHVKRELRLLNAALAQVIAASDNTNNQLKTEMRDLQQQVEELTKSELVLREELRTRTALQTERRVDTDVRKVITTSRTTQTLDDLGSVDGFQRNPAVEWTEILSLLKNLTDGLPNLGGQEKTDATHLVGLQQAQISELLSIVRHMQQNAQPSSALPVKAKENLPPAELFEDHKLHESIAVLQKMLTEREDEIEYWRTLVSRRDNAQSVGFVSLYSVVEDDLPSQYCYEMSKLDGAASQSFTILGTSGCEPFVATGEKEIQDPTKPASGVPANLSGASKTQLHIGQSSGLFPVAESLKVEFGSRRPLPNVIQLADPGAEREDSPQHLSETFGEERRPLAKLELPSIDYATIRDRSRLQLEQLQSLCRRYDQSQFHSRKLLPDNFDLALD